MGRKGKGKGRPRDSRGRFISQKSDELLERSRSRSDRSDPSRQPTQSHHSPLPPCPPFSSQLSPLATTPVLPRPVTTPVDPTQPVDPSITAPVDPAQTVDTSIPLTPNPLDPTGPVRRQLFPRRTRHSLVNLVIDRENRPNLYRREGTTVPIQQGPPRNAQGSEGATNLLLSSPQDTQEHPTVSANTPVPLLEESKTTRRIFAPAIPYEWHPESAEQLKRPELTDSKTSVAPFLSTEQIQPAIEENVGISKQQKQAITSATDKPSQLSRELSSPFQDYRDQEPSLPSSSSRSNKLEVRTPQVPGSPLCYPTPNYSISSLLAQFNMDDGQPESSKQGAARHKAKQNPIGTFGGDARNPLLQPGSGNPAPGSDAGTRRRPNVPYSRSDHYRDAAILVEVANVMSLGDFDNLHDSLSFETIYRARQILSELPDAEKNLYLTQALARMTMVTKSPEFFQEFVDRFQVGPNCESPRSQGRRRESGQLSPALFSDNASPQRRPRRDSSPVIVNPGPAQRGWEPTAQPMDYDAQYRGGRWGPYRDYRNDDQRGDRPAGHRRDQDDDIRPRNNRDQDDDTRPRNNRDHRRQDRQDTRDRTSSMKIEHQLFIYHDTEPVSAYISKLDHLVHRYGEAKVMDNLIVGILLDAKSPGAKWFMALPSEEREDLSADYSSFKTQIQKRFGKDRNTMMQRGDRVTHSFENEENFSANDYLDEKIKWYNEAGSLTEDWQALRAYNGLDEHLKTRIAMKTSTTNTMKELRDKVAENHEAAYEEFKRRKAWTSTQERLVKENSRQIQEVKSLVLTRQQYNSNQNQGQNRQVQNKSQEPAPVVVPAGIFKALQKVPDTNVVKPPNPEPADNGGRNQNWGRGRGGWFGSRNNWNNNNYGRNNWNSNGNNNWNNNWNNNFNRRANGSRDNGNENGATNAPNTSQPAIGQEARSAKVFTVDGQTYIQDDSSRQAYHIPDEEIPSIIDQIEMFQPDFEYTDTEPLPLETSSLSPDPTVFPPSLSPSEGDPTTEENTMPKND
ncbi:hypothetical protein GQX73_g10197 [Xylaria multiplex]|uniref:Uncharacterized protein n=1 Tax=Xylaria multiplex TaxID=323545 RepID=A0A7C8IPR3_9PEZI|nr:hypothetical protein GQX73_g10197 [Xylaria multiplex]